MNDRTRNLLTFSALAIGGVLLAHDLGHWHGRIVWVTLRNPLTLEFVRVLRAYAPAELLAFVGNVGAYLYAGPAVLLAGGLLGCCLSYRRARLGVIVCATYTLWFGGRLLLEFVDWDFPWWSFLTPFLFDLSLVPLYLLGVHCGEFLCRREKPTWRMRDLMITTSLTGLLLLAIRQRSEWGAPAALFAVLGYAAFATAPRTNMAPNVRVR